MRAQHRCVVTKSKHSECNTFAPFGCAAGGRYGLRSNPLVGRGEVFTLPGVRAS